MHKVAHPIWRDRPLRLAQPAGSSENMSLLHRAPRMLFNFLIRVVPFGCCLVFSLVCVLLKLPFPKLIFRMEFGRTNRAPVGRVHLPCREEYEKGQDDRFHQQVRGGEKKKNHAHTHISTLKCFYAQLGFNKPSAYFSPKLLFYFSPCVPYQEKWVLHFSNLPVLQFCLYGLLTHLLLINSWSSMNV